MTQYGAQPYQFVRFDCLEACRRPSNPNKRLIKVMSNNVIRLKRNQRQVGFVSSLTCLLAVARGGHANPSSLLAVDIPIATALKSRLAQDYGSWPNIVLATSNTILGQFPN